MLPFLVRLACVRHAASVDSEPGSNSRLKPEIYSLRSRPPWPREGTTANFVSTLGLEPEPFLLITGTFNLFVKDRIAFRLSGAYSVQSRVTQRRIPLSSKPFKTTCARRSVSTLRNPETSTTFAQAKKTQPRVAAKPAARVARATFCARRDASPVWRPIKSRHEPIRKRSNLRKDRLEVLAKRANPSRSLVPECEPRGRG